MIYHGNVGHLRAPSRQAQSAETMPCIGSWIPDPPRHTIQQRTPTNERSASFGKTANVIKTATHAISSLFVTVGILALLSTLTVGQTQGDLPFVYQASTGAQSGVCSTSPPCMTVPENLAVNDLAFVGVSCDEGSVPPGNAPPWPISDPPLGNTWTVETAASAVDGGRGPQGLQIAFSPITNGGADYFHVANLVCGGDGSLSYVPAMFKGLGPVSLDGAVVTANSGAAVNGAAVASTSKVVAVNGEIAIGAATMNVGNSTGVIVPYGSNTQFAATDNPNNGGGNTLIYFSVCGAAGTTCTQSTAAYGGGTTASVMQTLYFKPAAMLITDTKLPDCAIGLFCAFTIHGVGGTSPLTCSITAGSLPSGMSAGGTGSCTFSGSPAGQSSASITFQISDGSTTASKTLTFTVGPSFKPVTAPTNKISGSADVAVVSTLTLPSPAQCGNAVLVCAVSGDDTHGGGGWVQAVNGTNNYIRDSLGSAVQRLPTITGVRSGPNTCQVLGPLPSTGTEVITLTNNQFASNGLQVFAVEVPAQSLAEVGVFNGNDPTSNTTTLSAVFNAPVDNMYVQQVGAALNPANVLTLSAPFSAQASGGSSFTYPIFGDTTGLTHGNVTGTLNYASGNPNLANMLVGLRPRLPSAACGETSGHLQTTVQEY